MLYILAVVLTVLVSFLWGFIITHFINKRKKLKTAVRFLISFGIGLAIAAGGGVAYALDCYHPDSTALKAMKSNADVTVTAEDNCWLFDGRGEDTLVIFYPGGKVDARAYAPLMQELAVRGADCCLVDMPANMAVFGIDRSDDIIAAHSYDHVYLAGHSMGGAAAAIYCSNNPDKTDGLILLAAYSTKELDESLKVLSVYGSEDKVLNMKEYEKNKAELPEDTKELIIEGGCHGQFGSYGEQKGDGKASISPEAQRSAAAEAVLELIRE